MNKIDLVFGAWIGGMLAAMSVIVALKMSHILLEENTIAATCFEKAVKLK